MQSHTFRAQVRTSPNIALVKYWGKYNEELILPINSSVSLTLDPEDLSTTTTIEFSEEHKEDQLWLNGQPHELTSRVKKILERSRKQAQIKYRLSDQQWNRKHFWIGSDNSFPTASGLASSASGLAALTMCLNVLFEGVFSQQEVLQLTRMGSGSACRSLFGGLVQWQGVPPSISKNSTTEQLQLLSRSCIAKQLIPEEDLSHIKIMIVLFGAQKKETSSTAGMKTSVQTSELIHCRNQIAINRINKILTALQKGDFNLLAETTSRDSNQFHAICLDTYPPIFYLNELSKGLIHLVDHQLNPKLNTKIGYTFDAGPHAFLIMHETVLQRVFTQLMQFYQLTEEQLNGKALKLLKQLQQSQNCPIQPPSFAVSPGIRLWLTNPGRGPQILSRK